MTERNLGESFGWWVGLVVNVMDPHESGRVQVRVFGYHDDITNIPDETLPWALPIQPTTSAAIGKIGTSPLGLIKGTRVIGFWADEDHQYPIVLGSFGKSGDIVPGLFENGAPKVDVQYGSAPAPSKASSPHPFNPYTYLNEGRIPIDRIDSGQVSIFRVSDNDGVVVTKAVAKGMRFPNAPTIGAADPMNNCPISRMLRQYDPLGITSSLKCLPSVSDLLKELLDMAASLSRAFVGMLANAIRNAILKMMQKLGIQKVLGLLNQIAQTIGNIKDLLNQLLAQACGINPITLHLFSTVNLALATALNGINTLAGTIYSIPMAVANISATATSALLNSIVTYPIASVVSEISARPPAELVVGAPPNNYVKQYGTDDPYPGYIVWKDPQGVGEPVFTPRNGEPNFVSASQNSTYVMENAILAPLENAILSGKLNGSTFSSILSNAEQAGKALGISMILGVGFNAIGALASSAVSTPLIAKELVKDNAIISQAATIIPSATVAVDKFIVKQALAVQKTIRMRIMTSNIPTLPGLCIL